MVLWVKTSSMLRALQATVKSRKQRDKDKKHPLLHLAHLDLQDATLQQVGCRALYYPR